jgi:hypothetical protein
MLQLTLMSTFLASDMADIQGTQAMEPTQSPPEKAEVQSTPAGATPAPTKPVRKRTTRACDECRVRKIKCTGLHPCHSCEEAGRGTHAMLPASDQC